jgi:hypothetical protein
MCLRIVNYKTVLILQNLVKVERHHMLNLC